MVGQVKTNIPAARPPPPPTPHRNDIISGLETSLTDQVK